MNAGERRGEALDDVAEDLQHRRHGHRFLPGVNEGGQKACEQCTKQRPEFQSISVQ
jgi:hypothetical protein